MKLALLVIDVQKAFFEINETTTQSLQSALEYINAAIEIFRENKLPVISIQHINEERGLVPGVDGFDLPDNLNILPDDLHFHKTYGNAFVKTDLLKKLQELEVDTVIITGFSAENCVFSTCRGAVDVDLFPIILRGSLASGKPENIQFVENISEVISIHVLEKALSK